MDCSHASLQPTPEQDASFAAEALAAGEFSHAAFHIGCALGADSERAEWLELLERLAHAAGPEPLRYVSLDGRVSFATAAVHAWLLARGAKTRAALELLSQVVRSKPDTDFARWGLTWMERPGASESVPPDAAAALLSSVLSKTAREDRDTFARLLRITEPLSARPPAHLGLRWLQGTILHRLGRLDDALTVAKSAHASAPGWLTATLLAGIHRARGEVSPALEAYQAAMKHDPAQLSTRLDAADMLCEQGRVEDGLRWYEDILRQTPGEPWASASMAYHRFLHHGARDALETLLQLDDTRPGHGRTRALAADATRRLDAFVDYLPSRTDAGIHALRHLALQPPASGASDSGPLTLTTSWLEAPSVQLSWELHRLWRGFPAAMDIAVQDLQKPDPRLPSGPVEFTLWRYTATRPTRAVPTPAPEVAAALAGLASLPFDAEQWWHRAEEVAVALASHEPEQWAHAMVHPPPPQGPHAPWTWLQRVQVASAFVIARGDGGWEGSRRRRVLLTLARGPMDWTVEAALLALAWVAKTTPEAHAEVLALFRALARNTQGYACYAHALACAHLQLPGLTGDERLALERRRHAIEHES